MKLYVVSSKGGYTANEIKFIATDYNKLLIYLHGELKDNLKYKDCSPNKLITESVFEFTTDVGIRNGSLKKANDDRLVKIKWGEVKRAPELVREKKISEVLK